MKKHSNPKGFCPQCRGTTLGGAVKCLYCGAPLPEPTRERRFDWRLPIGALVVLFMGVVAWQLWLRPATPEELARQLYDAVAKNDYDATQRLLARGADPNMVADGCPPPLVEAITPDRRIAELLLQKGADPNKTTGENQMPLDRAIGFHNYALARRLMDAGANVNLYSRHWGNSPLMLALVSRAPRDFTLDLIRRGADVNTANVAGETALMSAVEMGDAVLVKELLARGADVSAKGSILQSSDKDVYLHLSALDMARRCHRPDIERLLLQKP